MSGSEGPQTVPFRIGPVRSRVDVASVQMLWRTYGELYADELGDQDLDAEAADLPKGYLEPDGILLLAYAAGAAVGMVAFKRLHGTMAVMKRLYVDQAWRGRGLGKVLVRAVEDAARDMGFSRMVLDTTESMDAARRLYQRLGYGVVAEPDWQSPCVRPVYMAKSL